MAPRSEPTFEAKDMTPQQGQYPHWALEAKGLKKWNITLMTLFKKNETLMLQQKKKNLNSPVIHGVVTSEPILNQFQLHMLVLQSNSSAWVILIDTAMNAKETSIFQILRSNIK